MEKIINILVYENLMELEINFYLLFEMVLMLLYNYENKVV